MRHYNHLKRDITLTHGNDLYGDDSYIFDISLKHTDLIMKVSFRIYDHKGLLTFIDNYIKKPSNITYSDWLYIRENKLHIRSNTHNVLTELTIIDNHNICSVFSEMKDLIKAL